MFWKSFIVVIIVIVVVVLLILLKIDELIFLRKILRDLLLQSSSLMLQMQHCIQYSRTIAPTLCKKKWSLLRRMTVVVVIWGWSVWFVRFIWRIRQIIVVLLPFHAWSFAILAKWRKLCERLQAEKIEITNKQGLTSFFLDIFTY